LVVFIFYILSRIVDKFFFKLLILSVDEHSNLALFSPDHHRLATHAAHHVKRVHRPAAKGQLKSILLDASLQRAFQIMGDLEEPVGRTQPADALMRSFVIVVLHPVGGSFHCLLEAVELRPKKKLALDAFPEALDLTQRHGVVGARSDVLDPVFFHFPLEAGLSAPVGVLPAVVGEHLTRHTVLGSSPPIGLQYMFGGLAAVKTKAGDVTRVVV
jgi:hypothetical protein